MRRIALMAAALGAGAAAAGCASVAPVAGQAMVASGFTYRMGQATQDFAYPNEQVQAAVLGAMDDLRVHSIGQSPEPGAVHFQGTTADDRRAMVTVRPFAGGTRLTARFGLLGDEPLSRALMDRTGIRLGALPPAAIPEKPPSKPGSLFGDEPDEEFVKEQAEQRFYDKTMP